MRVAYFCFDAGVPVFGTRGSSLHIRNVVGALSARGHDVRVFSVTPGVPDADECLDVDSIDLAQGHPAHLIAREAGLPDHLASELRALFRAQHAQRDLRDRLRAFQPDVIYERYSLFGDVGAVVAEALGVPFILEVNAPLFQEQTTYRKLVLRETAQEMERRIFTAADAVFVVSPSLAAYARELGVSADKVTVLPNAVDPVLFDPAGHHRAEVRHRLGLDDKFVIGFVGSLKPWHDMDTLVAAARRLNDLDDSVHLLIVGDGPGRGDSDQCVSFIGSVNHAEIPSHLAAMDVVAVPYPADGETYFSPLKMFEAMAMARPVVGARIGQVAELMLDERTGLLYEAGNVADLVDKLVAIMQRADRGAALGGAARAWVLDGHTWDDTARHIESAVADVSADQNSRLAPRLVLS